MKSAKLAEYIELNENRNVNFELSNKDVVGITISKQIIPTKANLKNAELKKFYIVEPNDFIYNPRTHGKQIGLGFNDTEKKLLISWNNISFRVKKEKLNQLNPKYLFIWFNRSEWDRNATFNSWGSSTEVFSWNELCDMEILIPNINIQNKYVAIYDSMKENLKVYQSKLDDLKLICDGYIEELKKEYASKRIEKYIKRTDERNKENKIKNVKGVSVYKNFREPTSKVNRNELGNYKIVHPKEISFVQTTHNEKVFAYALNNTKEDIVVSSVNEVFKVDDKKLLPEYLSLFFNRTEFDRYVRFNSWGSARETFTWNDLIEVKIPIPNIETQKSIVSIYNEWIKRKEIYDSLNKLIDQMNPIIIKGAIQEGEKYE